LMGSSYNTRLREQSLERPMLGRPDAALPQIHIQIMWIRLIAVVEEQAQTLVRAAFSDDGPCR
jgi:hypothetical protein